VDEHQRHKQLWTMQLWQLNPLIKASDRWMPLDQWRHGVLGKLRSGVSSVRETPIESSD
jgi:hypothetical protein